MANKALFKSTKSTLPRTDAVNEAGGRAHALPAKHALAQLAATGCFNGVFYASAETQLTTLLDLIKQVDDTTFLAKLAVYSRERAFMKDMPAALLLAVAKRDRALCHTIFDRVVTNGRVLRTLFQMVRSGQFGAKSLSSSLRRAFQRWLNGASVGTLLSASIGHDPSLRDVMRLARPTPPDNARRAFFGWLTDKPADKWAPATIGDLPIEVEALRAFRAADNEATQVAILGRRTFRWDLLADAAKGPLVWKAIARQMGTQALRMNLNTLRRHGVFDDADMVRHVADRLTDAAEIRGSGQFPYQYLSAYLNADAALPAVLKESLAAAAEIACGNVPALAGPVVIGLDVSSSMSSPVTGHRGHGSTSKVTCVDVASLFAAAILRRNPDSVIVPFDTRAFRVDMGPEETVLRLAERLRKYGGGGTDCSLPLAEANTTHKDRAFIGCVLVSDNQSWVGVGQHSSTAVMTQWQAFVKNQARLGGERTPKLACIDVQPYVTTQAPERADILNVGGFSDAVFGVVSSFFANEPGRFVSEVEAIAI